MRTWSLVHHASRRFAELTWNEYEVEVTLGVMGEEGKTQRHSFHRADELCEFIEDWLEDLTLDGFVPGTIEPPRDQPLPYAELEARAQALRSLGDCVDEDDDVSSDPLHDEHAEEDEAYFDDEPPEPEPDYVVKSMVSLSVDEAFKERIKEDPYDFDKEDPYDFDSA